MPEEFEIQKLKNELKNLGFSTELLDFVLSEETTSKIVEICLENRVEDEEKIGKITRRTTLVLLDQIPKENFAGILEKGVGLDTETAKKIAGQINERIFSQMPKPQSEVRPEKPAPPRPGFPKEEAPKPPPEKKVGDIYREPTE